MKRLAKVRFNLSRGKNYMKWKVVYPSGAVRYYDPSLYTVTMTNCFLRNQPTTALKIFVGGHKKVCAWVECESVKVEAVKEPKFRTPLKFKKRDVKNLKEGFPTIHMPQCRKYLEFNPRTKPYWFAVWDEDHSIDASTYETLETIGTKIFYKENMKFPELRPAEICGVQPMTSPVGSGYQIPTYYIP